ncbi:MAG: iron-sulfur cluster assembly scaffold protein [Candidatus Diapherotrites archaeon]|nr:iron-sulfur cluster assembly scaffold protein [Candidatus Diapherotrites archaeon]
MNDSELFSEIILELSKNPHNRGEIKDATLVASGGNPVCGDRMTIFLKVKNEVVVEASFLSSGCAISTAAASVLTGMVKGKRLADVLAITPDALFAELGGLIQTRIKCATLALVVAKEGLRQQQYDPSKRLVSGISV